MQNVNSIGAEQTVFLKPGRYRFEAYVRTSEVSTDEGAVFLVEYGAAANRLSFTTENMLGTDDWKLVEHSFQVPPGTALVQVSVMRKPF